MPAEPDEEDGYRLQPEDAPREESPSPTAEHWLHKAEADLADETSAARPSSELLKEGVASWWQKAKGVATGLGQGAKTLAESGARKAEAATIRTVSLPKAQAALGRAVYQTRRHAEEFPQLHSELDELIQQAERLPVADAAADASLLDRAKQSVRRAADAAASKALSLKIAQRLQRLGADCYERFGADCGPPELVAAVRSLRDRLRELDE